MNEKPEHGGGRLPVMGGEDHTPVVGDHTQYCTHSNNLSFHYIVHKQSIGWGCNIRETLVCA